MFTSRSRAENCSVSSSLRSNRWKLGYGPFSRPAPSCLAGCEHLSMRCEIAAWRDLPLLDRNKRVVFEVFPGAFDKGAKVGRGNAARGVDRADRKFLGGEIDQERDQAASEYTGHHLVGKSPGNAEACLRGRDRCI